MSIYLKLVNLILFLIQKIINLCKLFVKYVIIEKIMEKGLVDLKYDGSESIDLLGFSVRTYNSLKKININTIEEFIDFPMDKFVAVRNLGAKSLDEIYRIKNELTVDSILPSEKEYKTFIGINGVKYIDIKIEDLDLSNRAHNCLKRAGIEYFSNIYSMLDEELLNIKNMGKSTVLEINELRKKVELNEASNMKSLNNQNEKYEYIYQGILNSLSSKMNLNVNLLFTEIMVICNHFFKENDSIDYIDKFLEDTNFIDEMYINKYIHNLLVNYVLDVIKNEIYGIADYAINTKMPSYFKNINYVNEILLELLYNNLITEFEDRYIVKYQPYSVGLKSILSENEYTIIMERFSGKTLDEIGKSFNITRERIRQIEVKILKKLNKLQLKFEEDIYKDIFVKYDINKDDFKIISKNMSLYYYLDIRFSKEKIDTKHKLGNALDDKCIPITFRKSIEKVVYQNYVRIGGKYIPCTRSDISSYVLQTFAKDSVRFEEFALIYMSIIEELGLIGDDKLTVMDRGYENRLAGSRLVLNSRGKKIRYYNYELYDFKKLLEELDLLQYNNVEYSTLKFFKSNIELMKEFDIRDEYELHNLLKMICVEDEYSNITFRRMPNIEFGVADRDYQVFELLLSLSPVTKEALSNAYEEEYGVYSSTVMANYLSSFDEYFYEGIYKIDTPELPNHIVQEFKNGLYKDFYLTSEVKELFKDKFPNENISLLNTLTTKKIGFKVYSNYIVRDTFNSATEYFYSLLTSSDIVDINKISSKVKEIITFSSQLYKLKREYEIIEFLQGKYINIRKLNAEGLGIDDINDYIDSVINFVGIKKYFTVYSINKNGFSHVLDELGFDDWFYTSLLVERKSEISYRKVGGTKILFTGVGDFKLKDLIETIIFSEDELFLDVYELNEILRNNYGINVEKQNILNSIYESEMFYDPISEKIYADYQVYYEEI